MDPSVELSVILPAHEECRNLAVLLPRLRQVLAEIGVGAEILLVVHVRDEETLRAVGTSAAQVVEQLPPGYGGAPRSPGCPFYQRLNGALEEAGFDRFAQERCEGF
jgi:hypothetical protein